MTTPEVPLRMELTFELPGTVDQVWDAIATANGISAWFMPTDLEEREGGVVCFHMGDDDSPGTVTGWEPPRRLEYVEPGWAALSGHDPASVTPLVTEFLVEAKSGGTCVLRVVSSAFGSGADWEQEFFDEMEKGWTPFFGNLALYLTNFPGQRVTSMSVMADLPGDEKAVWAAFRDVLGVEEVGQPFAACGLTGTVERLSAPPRPDANQLLLRVTDPVPGYLIFGAWDKGDGKAGVMIGGYLFSEDAAAYVDRGQAAWKDWLESLPVPAT